MRPATSISPAIVTRSPVLTHEIVAREASENVFAISGSDTESYPASSTDRKMLAEPTANARQARADSSWRGSALAPAALPLMSALTWSDPNRWSACGVDRSIVMCELVEPCLEFGIERGCGGRHRVGELPARACADDRDRDIGIRQHPPDRHLRK